MKKIILLGILIFSLVITGCSGSFEDSNKNTENNQTVEKNEMTDIDISSMEQIIEPIIYTMIADNKVESYSEVFSAENISWTAYCMIYWASNYDTSMITEQGIIMPKDELHQQIKAVYNDFDGAIIPDIYEKESNYSQLIYSEEDDTYTILAGDPGCWINVDVKDAVMGADGRGIAEISVTLQALEGDEDKGMYEVSLVKNDDTSLKYPYSITNIEKIIK